MVRLGWRDLGRIWGGFGEDLGRIWGGLGRRGNVRKMGEMVEELRDFVTFASPNRKFLQELVWEFPTGLIILFRRGGNVNTKKK